MVRTILIRSPGAGRPSRLEEARAFVAAYLREGPQPTAVVVDAGRLVGISDRTLRRAAVELGVVSSRQGFGGAVIWALSNT